MTDAAASGAELVAVAREFARKGGFFPTPGQLVEAIRVRRLKALREERERAHERPAIDAPSVSDERHFAGNLEWNVARNNLTAHHFVPAGWSQGWRDRQEIWDAGYDIYRRGHRGLFAGETIAAALERERGERRECESRGEEWFPPTYKRQMAEASR